MFAFLRLPQFCVRVRYISIYFLLAHYTVEPLNQELVTKLRNSPAGPMHCSRLPLQIFSYSLVSLLYHFQSKSEIPRLVRSRISYRRLTNFSRLQHDQCDREFDNSLMKNRMFAVLRLPPFCIRVRYISIGFLLAHYTVESLNQKLVIKLRSSPTGPMYFSRLYKYFHVEPRAIAMHL